MHVDEAIRSRKSVRRFLPTPVPAAVTVPEMVRVEAPTSTTSAVLLPVARSSGVALAKLPSGP